MWVPADRDRWRARPTGEGGGIVFFFPVCSAREFEDWRLLSHVQAELRPDDFTRTLGRHLCEHIRGTRKRRVRSATDEKECREVRLYVVAVAELRQMQAT